MKKVAQEFSRYLIVGGVAFVADFLSLLVLTELAGLYYLMSATVAFLIGTVINYLLSTRWVFEFRAVSNRVNEFMIFATIGAVGVLLNACIIAFFVELAHFHYAISKLFATGSILFFNFGIRKILLFSAASIKLRIRSDTTPSTAKAIKNEHASS